MGVYECSRCVKMYEAEVGGGVYLCPFCRDAVKAYSGPRPQELSEAKLVTPELPILPLPEVLPITYGFVRLADNNLKFWNHYVRLMRFIASNMFCGEKVYGFQQAVKGFLDALACFEKTPTSEVWVAYAALGDVSTVISAKAFVKIEMCMTVTTHPDIQISTHMGIFRSPLRMVDVPKLDAIKHLGSGGVSVADIIPIMERKGAFMRPVRNLSVQLHAFAAKRCLQESSGVRKRFMITAPLKKMLEILRDQCGAFSTEKIVLCELEGKILVQVGDVEGPKGGELIIGNIQDYAWLTELADLGGGRPKIAIEIDALATSMDEGTRIEAILDWLEKWR